MVYKNWMQTKIVQSNYFQDIAFDEINHLLFVERKGKKVKLTCGTSLIEFVSCSYLGLDQDKRLVKHSNDHLEELGIAFSAARTRMQPAICSELEFLLKNIYCNAYAIVFPTIHMAHLGLFPVLGSGQMPSFPVVRKGFTFLIDKTAHSSIQINRGLLEQFGKVVMVACKDQQHLEDACKKIQQDAYTAVIIADGIGSMGGIAPIKFLLELAERYNGYVYLDDAHGTSIHGNQGAGYALKCLDYEFHPRLILVNSLAKGFGVLGGVLLFKQKEDADFIKRFAPTYVFSGPLALPVVNAAVASAKIHLSEEIHHLQAALWDNVNYFDSLLVKNGVKADISVPFRGILVGDELKAIEYTKKLRKRGFAVTAAMYPTVARNQSLLRIAISAAHSKQDIFLLCQTIKEIFQ
jgi:7-keto-8-aminopelargonate synthetase-like enzyme